MVALSASALFSALIWLLVAGLVFWLLWWLIGVIAPPEPFRKIAVVVLAVAAVIICINVLMTLMGHPLIALR